MQDPNAEVQANDTEMTTLDLANEVYDEMEAAEQETVETPEVPDDAPIKDIEPKDTEKVEETPEEKTEEKETDDNEVTIEAPSEWNSELKAAFDKQTPEGKEALKSAHKNMYGDYQRDKQALVKEKQEFEPQKQMAQPIIDHLNRHANVLQQRNVDPVKYTEELIKWADGLIYNPDKTMDELNGTFNKKQESTEWVSPEQEQINALTKELEQIKFTKQQEVQTQQQQFDDHQKVQQADAEDRFRTAPNADGSLMHPHFDDPTVKQYMNVLAGNEIINLQKLGKTPQDLTPTEAAESQEKFYTEAVRLAGKDVQANKAPVEKPQRIKATAPVETTPNLSTKQIAEQEWDRMNQA